MARESAASLAIVRTLPGSRPEPPGGLSERESALWREIVDAKPADWFGPDTAPLLTEYVRALALCDTLDEKIKSATAPRDDPAEEAASVGLVKLLLGMRDKESRRATTIATKLRLTQQSRYTPQAAATANRKAGGKRPWEA